MRRPQSQSNFEVYDHRSPPQMRLRRSWRLCRSYGGAAAYSLRRSQPQTVFLIYGGRRLRQSSLRLRRCGASNISVEDRSQIRVRHGGTSCVFESTIRSCAYLLYVSILILNYNYGVAATSSYDDFMRLQIIDQRFLSGRKSTYKLFCIRNTSFPP